MDNEDHTVKWFDGDTLVREENFPPYAAGGRSSFIRSGIKGGFTVTEGGIQVELYDDEILGKDYWRHIKWTY